MSQGQIPGVRTDGEPPPLTDEQIRAELNRVLASHEFRTSKRSRDFLCYVVENTLAGHAALLKERTIGIEVFGRPTSYDPSDDATVRVKAGEVRKRLGLYYSTEGAANPLRIELPSGTYIPEFHPGPAPAAVAAAPLAPSTDTVPVPPPHRRPFRVVAIAMAIGLMAVIASWWLLRSRSDRP